MGGTHHELTDDVELPWEPSFEMPDYKELGRALMSFGYTPRPEDEPAPPNFENDPAYERAVLDACVPPEPLCPATSKPSLLCVEAYG
jgi:hypothetical protein